MATLRVRHFTDPMCPYAFSAEPALRRIEWLYGDQLQWRLAMVVLSESTDVHRERGFDAATLSASLRRFQRWGMPIDAQARSHVPASQPACRAVVALRLHRPDLELALLRRLRVLHFAGDLIDDPGVIEMAADGVEVGATELRDWLDDEEVSAALEEDKRTARDPTAQARHLERKLQRDDGCRYTCPSLELGDGAATFSIPGFEPLEAYEVALANLDASLERRDDPEDVAEVLEWAQFPLATSEVAAVCGSELDPVREQLARVARFEAVGSDGYWTLG